MKSQALSDYRSVLKLEYENRCQKNKSYSLRAFARDLKISPSRLSEILSNKQGLSPKKALEIGKSLKYSQKKLDWFCNLVGAEYSRSPYIKAQSKEKLAPFKNGVQTDLYSTANAPIKLKWYHYIIRRLTAIKNFKSSPEWISKKISLSLTETEAAIQEMLKAGLLRYNEKKQLSIDENIGIYSTPPERSTIINALKDMFNNSLQAPEKFPVTQRHNTFHVFAYNSKQIEDVKALIQEFEDKLDHLTYKTTEPDAVYTVMLSLTPNTELPKDI